MRRLALALAGILAGCGLGVSGSRTADAPDGAPPETDAAITGDDSAAQEIAVDAGDACANGACVATCALDGLVAYYPFDGDAADHSGNGHDLTTSGVSAAAGKIGGALAFDGATSRARASGSLALNGARTFVAWVEPETVTGLGQPVFTGGVTNSGDMFAVQSSTPGGTCTAAGASHLFLDHWSTACAAASGAQAASGAWSFVAWTYDGTGETVAYANGVTQSFAAKNYDYDLDTVTIGANTIGGTTTQGVFKGVLDEVAIYGRALGAAELDALYAAGAGCRAK